MLSSLFGRSRKFILLVAAALIAAIAVIDWRLVSDLPLGFLYLVPMAMLGRVLRLWQIAIFAVICTVLSELYDQFAWNLAIGLPRDVLYFAAFFCMGLFVYEMSRSRHIIQEHLGEIERQRDARREAEEQLKVLIESSPAAIITADADGCVLMANEAAHRMLALAAGELSGHSIHRYFPSLSNVSRGETRPQMFRAVMQSRGLREDGEVFLADICFSTYRTDAGSRLAAMILDTSEELRTREEASLHQLMAGSRIAMGAISHEIRNICGAIAVVHQNLSRNELLGQNKDFEALGNLVVALERIAAVDLRQSPDNATEVDLISVLDELRIVIAPSLREEDIACTWTIEPDLPLVWADRANLMQVFLNLVANAIRALSLTKIKTLAISAKRQRHLVSLEFIDNGCGIDHPERLFHPFQDGAKATGLGLYLSRAFMRSFGGELRNTALPSGACFVVELSPANQLERAQ